MRGCTHAHITDSLSTHAQSALEVGCRARRAPRLAQVVLGFTLVAMVTHLLALVSPYWEYAENDYGTAYSGLWRVCVLGACDSFSNHPLYAWFHVVQACMVLSYVTLSLSLLLATLHTFSSVREISRATWPRPRPWLSVITVSVYVITALLCTCGVALYGYDQGGSDPISLSWGYALALVSMVTEQVLAVLCICAYVKRLAAPCIPVTPITLQPVARASPPPSPPRLQRSESMPCDDVFCSETVPLYEVRNRVNSYTAPDTPSRDSRSRAFSFNVIRERAESFGSDQDPFSHSLNIS